jgi:short-subunit dehydrogenase
VTGASSGIGEAIARELAARGHALILVARREPQLRDLADDLTEMYDVRAEPLACDLGDAGARERLAARVEALGLDVEVLVNNAGFGSGRDFAEEDRELLLAMVRLNCEALLDLQARYLPGMLRRGRGTVINIASTASFQPIPGNAVYAATKAFVLSLGEATHVELRGSGVTVTTVCPGPVRTEFPEVAGIADTAEKVPSLFWMSPEDLARDAVDAAERGKRAVVPGVINRAGAIMGQHTPRTFALRIARQAWRQAT